jgi:hypothetical protein
LPGAYLVSLFHWDRRDGFSRRGELVRRALAFLTLGNRWFEEGGMLWANVEFIHAFSSVDALRSEFEEGGFEVVHIHIPEKGIRGGAVLRKAR